MVFAVSSGSALAIAMELKSQLLGKMIQAGDNSRVAVAGVGTFDSQAVAVRMGVMICANNWATALNP